MEKKTCKTSACIQGVLMRMSSCSLGLPTWGPCTLSAPRFEVLNLTCCVSLIPLSPFGFRTINHFPFSHFIQENPTGFSSSNNAQNSTLSTNSPSLQPSLRWAEMLQWSLTSVTLCWYLRPPEHQVSSLDISWKLLFVTGGRPVLHTLPFHLEEKPSLGNSL